MNVPIGAAIEGSIKVLADSAAFHVRVTPASRQNRVDGWKRAADGSMHLAVRVTAPPERGEANTALVELLADLFDLPKSRVSIASGYGARLKKVIVIDDGVRVKARLLCLGDA